MIIGRKSANKKKEEEESGMAAALFNLDELGYGSPRFNNVAGYFHFRRKTYTPFGALKVTRVFQIRSDAEPKYALKREQMRQARGAPVNEETLFHGTSLQNALSICKEGFRIPRVSHKFGYSICFSRASSYSESYAKCTPLHTVDVISDVPGARYAPVQHPPCFAQAHIPNPMAVWDPCAPAYFPGFVPKPLQPCRHYTLMCDVLVGDPALGPQFVGHRHPPSRPEGEGGYDSLKGTDVATNTIAVFDPHQAKPAYLIEFTYYAD